MTGDQILLILLFRIIARVFVIALFIKKSIIQVMCSRFIYLQIL